MKESVSCCKDAEKSAISSCFVANADAWLNNNTNESILLIIIMKVKNELFHIYFSNSLIIH